jgi:hypothetical protein
MQHSAQIRLPAQLHRARHGRVLGAMEQSGPHHIPVVFSRLDHQALAHGQRYGESFTYIGA